MYPKNFLGPWGYRGVGVVTPLTPPCRPMATVDKSQDQNPNYCYCYYAHNTMSRRWLFLLFLVYVIQNVFSF